MSDFAFSKINYILLAIGFAIVLLGFILMSGEGTTEEAFNPDIFSDLRIKVAPMVSLFGFIFVIVAILWRSKDKK
jgi:membrane-bound ClpP family serine protease